MAALDDSELEQVCTFIRDRGLPESTVSCFKRHKMDFQAIAMSSCNDLQELAGCVRGDAIHIKHFAETKLEEKLKTESYQQKVKLLEETLQHGSKTRLKAQKKQSTGKCRPVRKAVRKVTIGWLHFNDSLRSFVQVREPKGGGVCSLELTLHSTREEILNAGIELFFKNGICSFGSEEDMDITLYNFCREEIKDEGSFTLEKYIDEYKRKEVKFFIATKKKSHQSCGSGISSHSDDDGHLMKSAFLDDQCNDQDVQIVEEEMRPVGQQNKDCDYKCSEQTMQNDIEERRRLIAEQDKEYIASLEADQKKRQQLIAEEEKVKRQVALMEARRARVPEEPCEGEEKVVIRVRHITQGIVERAFAPNTFMNTVYDWVGSLNLVPEEFVLSDFRSDLLPSESVESCSFSVLNMTTCSHTPSLDEDVNFRGFGDDQIEESGNNSSLCEDSVISSSAWLATTSSTVPTQLMEDDPSTDEENINKSSGNTDHENQCGSQEEGPGRRFRMMVNTSFSSSTSTQSETPEEPLDNYRHIDVSRNNVLADMLQLYDDKSILGCKLNVHFEGEMGLDFGGLTKDLFTSLWNAAYDEYFEGDTVKVPFARPHQQLQMKAVFQKFGRILYHGWLLTKEIPIRFCEASFVCLLHGEESVDESMLERCFLLYLSQYERDVLTKALLTEVLAPYQQDAIFGVYEQYNMTCAVAKTQEQLRDHVVIMARSHFLYKPMSTLMWMASGIPGNELEAWRRSLSVERIKKLYEALLPSVEKTLASLHYPGDLRPAESRVLSYLRNYVGSMDDQHHDRFLRFVTGSPAAPQKPIQVAFNATVGLRRCPSSSTCSSTLFLSTAYLSFTEFKKEFNIVLGEDTSFEMGTL